MSLTIKDIAKNTGVSSSTVSRVLSGDSRISAETKKRVLAQVEKSGYRINTIARSLKTSKSYTIGFICPDITNDFFMSVAKGVEDELRKNGYSMIICSSNESAAEEEERLKLLREKCVDGIILIPVSGEGGHIKRVCRSSVPVVLVDRLVSGYPTDAVLVDNIEGSYSAMEYLIKSSSRRIGFIGGDIHLTSAKERHEGYLKALADYHIPVDDSIIKFGDFHVKSGYEIMRELMELPEPPGEVFISNYFMHVGAVKYLIEHRDTLKKQVSITSFDRLEFSPILDYSKLFISQPVIELGSSAAGLVLSRINKEHMVFPQTVRLKTNLIIK